MRSVGHLTTYGPTDSPTFTTPSFSFSRKRRIRMKPRTSYLILQLQYPLGDTDIKLYKEDKVKGKKFNLEEEKGKSNIF